MYRIVLLVGLLFFMAACSNQTTVALPAAETRVQVAEWDGGVPGILSLRDIGNETIPVGTPFGVDSLMVSTADTNTRITRGRVVVDHSPELQFDGVAPVWGGIEFLTFDEVSDSQVIIDFHLDKESFYTSDALLHGFIRTEWVLQNHADHATISILLVEYEQ